MRGIRFLNQLAESLFGAFGLQSTCHAKGLRGHRNEITDKGMAQVKMPKKRAKENGRTVLRGGVTGCDLRDWIPAELRVSPQLGRICPRKD
ncbi:MAG: hypothetical protein CME19_17000 [Gemmatimonadetes bacterium]|nr:hypothetical protein [Gemmatimonadota bacterium]